VINAYPLTWPDGWKRTAARDRKNAAFNRKERDYSTNFPNGRQVMKWLTVNDGVQRILGELSRMGIDREDVIISTNVPTRLDGLPKSNAGEPGDPGAAVYWRQPNRPMRCMAIDRYTMVADNLAAIAATLEAMRAIERHGGAQILDRAFTGFAALPEKASQPWRDVLGLKANVPVSKDAVIGRFRELAKQHHSDIPGGSDEKMRELIAARDQALDELQQEAS
jgi:hypothetical protein